MAALTVNDFAQQMVAQARVLDPSFSGEIGTPERKMIDAVAASLAANQIDLTGLQSALSIDSKVGTNLDRFTALFGMQRQQASAATGYVVFSTTSAATQQIVIPAGTTLQNNVASTGGGTLTPLLGLPMQYTTTASGTIEVDQTTSSAVPIQAAVTGSAGNTAANTITIITGQSVPGVTAVTNPNALTNGLDVEDDNSYKTRFKNTWARNLAGVADQYLALALSGTFTTKAVVIGAQSTFQEYIQVPDYDDAGYLDGTQVPTQDTLGTQNQWTTALSTIPYAKQIYTDVETFISNGQQGIDQVFYTPDVDFQFNYPPLPYGDSLRTAPVTTTSGSQALPEATITVASTIGFPTSGVLSIEGAIVTYTDKTSTTFTGCLTSTNETVPNDTAVYYVEPLGTQPNFTFLNVFNPSNPVSLPGLQALVPGQVVLSEFCYVSSASRNDVARNIDNAVDVYVDGSNDLQTSCIVLPNVIQNASSPVCVFNTNPNSPWYYENYRRDGEPVKRPQLSNYITPLFQSPIDSLPSAITLNGQTLNLNTDYWLVHEIGSLGGTIRARDGIEWNVNSSPSNNIATASLTGDIPLEVDNYAYDANIVALQASIASTHSRQITTDVLIHKAVTRYLKLDFTVMYSSNTNPAVVNAAIAASVQAFFANQYFGSVIQLSTLLEIIHEVNGVENVRWSNDLPTIPDSIRVLETDVNGNPLHGASIDILLLGSGSVVEQQTLYVVGAPNGDINGTPDSFTLTWTDAALPGGFMTTAAIPFFHTSDGSPLVASNIQSAITAVAPGSGKYHNITVTQDSRPTTNVVDPILSFTITYGAVGAPVVPAVNNTVTSSSYTYDADFFLLDDELPALPAGQLSTDTLPGLIIRVRAQNTFLRPGLG